MAILLKNGLIATFVRGQPDPKVERADILVEGCRISKIGSNLQPPQDCEIMDASKYIISPGFVDGHRHVWQALLRGLLNDMTLPQYMIVQMWSMAGHVTAEEAYWGQLAGMYELAFTGFTTVMDCQHLGGSKHHVEETLKATLQSKVRSIFAPARTSHPTSLHPLTFNDAEADEAWQVDQIFELLGKQKKGEFGENSRVQIGLAYDIAGAGPKEPHQRFLKECRERGIKHISAHFVSGPSSPAHFGPDSMAHIWQDRNIIGKDVIFSHASNATDEDFQIIKSAGATISASPEDELTMAHGWPIAFEASQKHGIRVGLGVDTCGVVGGDPFAAMRVALSDARGRANAEVAEVAKGLGGKAVLHPLKHKAKDVFRMLTLGGAEALRMEGEIGSIEEGKLGDLIMIRADSPGMVGFADAIRSIVYNASISDIHHVLIGGEWVKRDEKLVRVDWDEIAAHVEKVTTALRNRMPTEEEYEQLYEEMVPKMGWTVLSGRTGAP